MEISKALAVEMDKTMMLCRIDASFTHEKFMQGCKIIMDELRPSAAKLKASFETMRASQYPLVPNDLGRAIRSHTYYGVEERARGLHLGRSDAATGEGRRMISNDAGEKK